MLNVNEIRNLEEKWEKYKRKQYIKIVLYIVLLLIVIFMPILFYLGLFDKFLHDGSHNKAIKKISQKNIIEKEKKEVKEILPKPRENKKSDMNQSGKNSTNDEKNDKSLTKNIIVKKNNIKTTDSNRIKVTKNTITNHNISTASNNNDMLQLNTNFLNRIYSRKKDINKTKTVLKQNAGQNDRITDKNNNTKSNISDIKKSIPKKITLKPKKPKIIISSKKIDKLKYLIERYNESGRVMYAIMISKEYYRKKMYKKSLMWATTANSIDSSNEESWIMFAKNKVKLNQKNDAINALKAYLKVNSSKKVRILLTNITNGVFR